MSFMFGAQFPALRPRRLRRSPLLRQLVSETELSASRLILPLFARPGKGERIAVKSMPGVFQLSVDEIVKESADAVAAGIPGVLLFGLPESKDEQASGAYASNGIVQQAVRAIKKEFPDLL